MVTKVEKIKAAVFNVKKAIVATLTTVILVILHKNGIEIPSDTVSVLVDAGIVYGVTYAIPNSKPLFEDESEDDDE